MWKGGDKLPLLRFRCTLFVVCLLVFLVAAAPDLPLPLCFLPRRLSEYLMWKGEDTLHTALCFPSVYWDLWWLLRPAWTFLSSSRIKLNEARRMHHVEGRTKTHFHTTLCFSSVYWSFWSLLRPSCPFLYSFLPLVHTRIQDGDAFRGPHVVGRAKIHLHTLYYTLLLVCLLEFVVIA